MSPSPDDTNSTNEPEPEDASAGARIIRFVSRRERDAQTASPGRPYNLAAGWVQFAVIVVLGLSFIAWFFVFR